MNGLIDCNRRVAGSNLQVPISTVSQPWTSAQCLPIIDCEEGYKKPTSLIKFWPHYCPVIGSEQIVVFWTSNCLFLFFPCMNCITNAALQWDILKNYILLNYKYYCNYCSFIIYSFTGKPTMHKTLSFQVFRLVSVPQAMSIPLSVFSRFSKKNDD